MKNLLKITFVVGLCVRLVLLASVSYAGDASEGESLLDELEAIDPEDNTACCAAIDEYASISCSGRKGLAQALCLKSKDRARGEVEEYCGLDSANTSDDDLVEALHSGRLDEEDFSAEELNDVCPPSGLGEPTLGGSPLEKSNSDVVDDVKDMKRRIIRNMGR